MHCQEYTFVVLCTCRSINKLHNYVCSCRSTNLYSPVWPLMSTSCIPLHGQEYNFVFLCITSLCCPPRVGSTNLYSSDSVWEYSSVLCRQEPGLIIKFHRFTQDLTASLALPQARSYPSVTCLALKMINE